MDEAKAIESGRSKVKDVAFRGVKAAVKAVIVYLLYFFLAPLFAPVFKLVPALTGTIETFVVVFIVLMVLGDLTERTIFQYFFGTARAMFVVAYLILSLGDGIINVGVKNFSLSLNLTVFYAVAVLLSLIGVARSLLQAISFMNERAEGSIQP
jgi:hypothetical protein